jgi:hypothetical protein
MGSVPEGRTFNVLVRMLVMGGIKDTQCGFKLFRGEVAHELFAGSRIDSAMIAMMPTITYDATIKPWSGAPW